MPFCSPGDAPPVVAHTVGYTPPFRAKDLCRILLITLPLMPLFIIWFWVVMALLGRWHKQVEVLVTADGTAWVTRRRSDWRPRKGSTLIGSQSLHGWVPTHTQRGWVEGDLAGLRLGLCPGVNTARLVHIAA